MICVWIRPKIYKIKNLKNKEKIINDFENKPLLLISQRIIFDKKQNISSSNVSSKSDNNQLNKFGVNISSVKETKSIMNIYSLIYGTINLIKFDIKSKQLKIIISTDINDLKIAKFEVHISKLISKKHQIVFFNMMILIINILSFVSKLELSFKFSFFLDSFSLFLIFFYLYFLYTNYLN